MSDCFHASENVENDLDSSESAMKMGYVRLQHCCASHVLVNKYFSTPYPINYFRSQGTTGGWC